MHFKTFFFNVNFNNFLNLHLLKPIVKQTQKSLKSFFNFKILVQSTFLKPTAKR